MKSELKMAGILAFVVLIVLSITACDDGGDNGNGGGFKTVTFSLDKVNDNTFTLTVAGATLKPSVNLSISASYLYGSIYTDNAWLLQQYPNGMSVNSSCFDGVRTSDTVVTYTFKSTLLGTITNGTVFLPDDNSARMYSLANELFTEHYHYQDTVKADPAKKSITWE